jgi:hypothetical protein
MQAARREVGYDDGQALELERGRHQVRERVGRDLGLATSLTRPLRHSSSLRSVTSIKVCRVLDGQVGFIRKEIARGKEDEEVGPMYYERNG